ncbi:hypothetical protein [Rhodanobacter lindaniclasticus]
MARMPVIVVPLKTPLASVIVTGFLLVSTTSNAFVPPSVRSAYPPPIAP